MLQNKNNVDDLCTPALEKNESKNPFSPAVTKEKEAKISHTSKRKRLRHPSMTVIIHKENEIKFLGEGARTKV